MRARGGNDGGRGSCPHQAGGRGEAGPFHPARRREGGATERVAMPLPSRAIPPDGRGKARVMTARSPASGVNPLVAGLRCRCPNCGEAPLFIGYLKVCDRCEACGEDLSRADSGDGPVGFILLIVGAIWGGGL